MNEQTLSLSLTSGEVITDPYWLHMEIVEEQADTGMTVGQAAAIIDSIYDVDMCNPGPEGADPWNLRGEREPVGDDLPSKDKFNDAIAHLSIPSCNNIAAALAGEIGAYDVQIKVFRSHQGELYKLRLSNGIAGPPVRMEERVTHVIDVENKTHITLDNPIIRRPVIIWQGIDGPKIHIMGNTLWWEGEFTGTLRAEFDTVYDLVNIHVHGEPTDSQIVVGTMPPGSMGTGWYSGTEDAAEITDYQDIDCSVLAFYHYEYEELQLTRPDDDESVSVIDRLGICSTINTPGPDFPADTGTCYQRKDVIEICDCSKKQTRRTYREAVECPEGAAVGSDLDNEETTTEYVSCGEKDSVSDPAYYEQICCEPWPFTGANAKDMPRCKTVYKEFVAKGDVDQPDRADLEAKYKNISFVTVGPEAGLCGEWAIEQIVSQQNCCDGVPPIVWDEENSAEVIDGTGQVFITGSEADIYKTWKVRGSGFYVDAALTQRDIATKNNFITIYQKPDACGTATVYVTDGCSSASGFVRSPNGHWQEISLDQVEDRDIPADSYVSLDAAPLYCGARSKVRLQAFEGKYRYQQTYLWVTESGPIDSDNGSCTCAEYVPDSWQPYAESVRSRHTMPSGEIQLINPFSGARLLPPGNELVFHQNGLQVVPDESDGAGRGYTKYCYQYLDPTNHLKWACATAGGSVFADGDDSACGLTNPQAWEWVC